MQDRSINLSWEEGLKHIQFSAQNAAIYYKMSYVLVVENFGAYYMEQKKREAISKKREDLAELRKSNNQSFKVIFLYFL